MKWAHRTSVRAPSCLLATVGISFARLTNHANIHVVSIPADCILDYSNQLQEKLPGF